VAGGPRCVLVSGGVGSAWTLDLVAPGSARGGDGATVVPSGLLAAVELLVDDGPRPAAFGVGAWS
jgi:hypothetical protein